MDGVYDSDPKKNPDAKKFDEITIEEVVAKGLGVVDGAAAVLAKENRMPMLVFGLNGEGAIANAARGVIDGTRVTCSCKIHGYSGGKQNIMSERSKAYEEKMEKTLKNLDGELQSIRAGRANPHVLDKITVDYYGTPTAIHQVANVTVPEARMIQIAPWEKNMLKEITKAIQKSDLGINPSNDGTVIRLIFPELTEERRKDLVKDVKKKGENAKVAVRNIRRDSDKMLKKLKKDAELSEDQIADIEDEILQKVTDKYVKKIDEAVDVKTKELMTI